MTLVQILVDIAVEVVSRHTLIDRVGLYMQGWRVRLWPKGAERSIQVFAPLSTSDMNQSVWRFHVVLAPAFFLVHSSSPCSPLPVLSSEASSSSFSSSSSSFRLQEKACQAGGRHPPSPLQRESKNEHDLWWYLNKRWFVNIILTHTIKHILTCTNTVFLCFPLSSSS